MRALLLPYTAKMRGSKTEGLMTKVVGRVAPNFCKRALNFCKRALNFRGKAHSKMRGQKTEVLAAKAVGRMVQPKEVSNDCSAW